MKEFEWTGPPQEPRKGPALKPGKKYKVTDFTPGVPEYWIKQGFAKEVKSEPKKITSKERS